MGRVLVFTGIAETVTGILLLIAPSLVASLLFGTTLTVPGSLFAQLAGTALIGLGTACWPGPVALGVLIYDVLVALLLVWVGVTHETSGPLLWPAVFLHAALVVPLANSIRQRRQPDA